MKYTGINGSNVTKNVNKFKGNELFYRALQLFNYLMYSIIQERQLNRIINTFQSGEEMQMLEGEQTGQVILKAAALHLCIM